MDRSDGDTSSETIQSAMPYENALSDIGEGYTAPHLGAEILRAFEGQLEIRADTLEQQFRQMIGHYGVPQG